MQGGKSCPRCGRMMTHDSIVCAYCGTHLSASPGAPTTHGKGSTLVCTRCGKWIGLRGLGGGTTLCEACKQAVQNEAAAAYYREAYQRQAYVRKVVADHPELSEGVKKCIGVSNLEGSFTVNDHTYAQIADWHSKIAHAKNLTMAHRYEDAAIVYERLGLWKEAGLAREQKSTTTVKHVTININDLIDKLRAGGLSVPYKCTSCGATITVGKDTDPAALKHCSYCGAALNIELLAGVLRDALR